MEVAALLLFYGLVFAGILVLRRWAWADADQWRGGWTGPRAPRSSVGGRPSRAGAGILPLERTDRKRRDALRGRKKGTPTRATTGQVGRISARRA